MNDQKIDYILAIDAGGSKTVARLKCLNTEQIWHKKAADASLSHDLEHACGVINKLAKSFLEDARCDANKILLVCGVAGGGNKVNRQILFDHLARSFSHINIYNDGRISLFGAGAGEPRIVLTVGTGSIATRLDNRGIESRFGGWGFVAGDFGSGAYMGKQLISEALIQYDKHRAMRDKLLMCDKLLHETIVRLSNGPRHQSDNAVDKKADAIHKLDLNNTKCINQAVKGWIQNATPTDYAAFAPLIFEYAKQSECALKIIKDAACWIEDLAKTAGFETKEYGDIPVVITGGLALAIKPFLSQKLSQALMPPRGSSLDGAIYLGEKIFKDNAV